MAANSEWLRVRGMGRERFAGHIADRLAEMGYVVERTESSEPAESHVIGKLGRMNPAVPDSAREVSFRLFPTSGGAAVDWLAPTQVPPADRPRLDRLVRELTTGLERAVLTESHATAKVTRAPDAHLPWESRSPP